MKDERKNPEDFEPDRQEIGCSRNNLPEDEPKELWHGLLFQSLYSSLY